MRPMLALGLGLTCALALHAQQATPPHPYNDGVARMTDKPPVPPSQAISITFGGRRTALSLDDLLKLPQTEVHVHNAHTKADENYTGPLLSEVLARAGLTFTKQTEPLILHSTIIATGGDGYFVLYSAAEVEPAFSRSQVVVAVMKSGIADAAGGNIQLINTDGARPARWVHGLVALDVVTLSARPKASAPSTPSAQSGPSVTPE